MALSLMTFNWIVNTLLFDLAFDLWLYAGLHVLIAAVLFIIYFDNLYTA